MHHKKIFVQPKGILEMVLTHGELYSTHRIVKKQSMACGSER